MPEILITGSRGFIGTAIRKEIKYPYTEIDLVLGTDHANVKGRRGTLIFLSSWVKPDESFTHPVMYLENNLTALLMLLTNNIFDRVIFPSSNTVYDKDGNLEPVSIYGLTKLAGEKLVKMYCKKYWILRLGNPYGENDRRSMFYELAKCKKYNRTFSMHSINGIVRDYFPVEHVASIINRILDGEIDPGIYNVGTGKKTVVADFIKNVCEKHNIEYETGTCQSWVSNGYIPMTDLIKADEEDLEKQWAIKYLR